MTINKGRDCWRENVEGGVRNPGEERPSTFSHVTPDATQQDQSFLSRIDKSVVALTQNPRPLDYTLILSFCARFPKAGAILVESELRGRTNQ